MRNLGFSFAVLLMVAAPALAQTTAEKEWPASPALATRPEAQRPAVSNDSMGGGAIPALPIEVMTSGGITYVTGGIGDEEIAQLKASEQNYNVHLLMTAGQGEFVSNVKLRVLDGKGTEMLVVDGAGPYFYARVTPGAYALEASDAEGHAKALKIKVPAQGGIKLQITLPETAGGVTTVHTPTAKIE